MSEDEETKTKKVRAAVASVARDLAGEELHTELGELISLNHDHRRSLGDSEVEQLARVIYNDGYRKTAAHSRRGSFDVGMLLTTYDQIEEFVYDTKEAIRAAKLVDKHVNTKRLMPVIIDDDGDTMTWLEDYASPSAEEGWHWVGRENVLDNDDLSLPVRILKGPGL